MSFEFSQAVTERLGYYVYILKDPRDNSIFYVGKGTGNRIFNHINRGLENVTSNDKLDLINSILNSGFQVDHYILRHNLTEDLAFEIESTCIDLLGLENLTNEVLGHNTWDKGIKTTDEIIQYYDAKPATIREPAIIININKQYRRFMSELDLYNATRHRWKLGNRHIQAVYAFASYRGLVREVYAIQRWNKCPDGRYEFEGQIAMPEIRDKYINQSLENYIKKGSRNPIRYTMH
ncbi:MAG TPA: hypothetical protein VK668_04105 [Mucilaginibacter sp.]|nr:hypothetical protein [Mucilaginibacter sp.]